MSNNGAGGNDGNPSNVIPRRRRGRGRAFPPANPRGAISRGGGGDSLALNWGWPWGLRTTGIAGADRPPDGKRKHEDAGAPSNSGVGHQESGSAGAHPPPTFRGAVKFANHHVGVEVEVIVEEVAESEEEGEVMIRQVPFLDVAEEGGATEIDLMLDLNHAAEEGAVEIDRMPDLNHAAEEGATKIYRVPDLNNPPPPET